MACYHQVPTHLGDWGILYIMVYISFQYRTVTFCIRPKSALIMVKKKCSFFFCSISHTFLFVGFMRFRWTLVHVFLKQIQRWRELENQYLSDSRKWKCENIGSFSNLKCFCGYFSFRCVFISMYKLTYLW